MLVLTVAAWFDFESLHSVEAHDRWSPLAQLFSVDPLVVDELNATLLPLVALICFLINYSTMRTKLREFSFAQSLAFEAILLATLSCKSSWGLVGLLIAGTIPPYFELRRTRKPSRVYLFHMLVFGVLLVLGRFLYTGASGSASASPSSLSLLVLTLALLMRSGIVPFHCWMTDLFENSTFGTALQFVTPMLGAYGVVRLVLPGRACLALADDLSTFVIHSSLCRRHRAGAARSPPVLLLPVHQSLVACAVRGINRHTNRPDGCPLLVAIGCPVTDGFGPDAALH